MEYIDKLKKQYKELGEQIEKLEKIEQKIQNDPIFLLSTKEYKKYKDKIPCIDCYWWWLRSPGHDFGGVTDVDCDGIIDSYGCFVNTNSGGVRPALKINPNEWFFKGDESRIVHCGVTWIQIDEGLYIAELPIAFKQFDTNNNDYSTSEVRQFLLDWYEERKDW